MEQRVFSAEEIDNIIFILPNQYPGLAIGFYENLSAPIGIKLDTHDTPHRLSEIVSTIEKLVNHPLVLEYSMDPDEGAYTFVTK